MGTLSGWAEAVLIMIAVVGISTFIVTDLNADFGTSYTLPFSNETNSYLGNFSDSTDTYKNELVGGTIKESEFLGIFPGTYWGVLSSLMRIIWDVVSGQWIVTTMSIIFEGSKSALLFAQALRFLFMLSIIMATIRIFVRIRP